VGEAPHEEGLGGLGGRIAWYFYLPVAYMYFKCTAETTSAQIQGDDTTSTENFDFWSITLEVDIADLSKMSQPIGLVTLV
jgi:hypothetical protein